MSWQRLVASAVVVGAVAGCQTPSGPPALDAAPVPRSQKPESESSKPAPASFLDGGTDDAAGHGRVVTTIRATVNGVPILDSDVKTVAPSTNPDDLRKALDMLIERELVLQDCLARFSKPPASKFLDKLKEAASREFDRQVVAKSKKKLNLKSDEEFKNFLASTGVSIDMLRKQWEKQFMYQQYLQFRVGPALDRLGHDEFRDYYDAHPEEFEAGDAVEWQDIFIAASNHPDREAARKAAEQVEARMKQGEDIAKLLPLDNGDSTYRKGDGLGNKRGDIKPHEAEELLFRLKDKETGIVEIAGGFHVVRVVKREFAGRMPFDEKTQNMIQEKLRQEVFAREAKQYLNELKRNASIQISKDGP